MLHGMAAVPDIQTPIWRTWLAKALLAWVGLALVTTLAFARLMELLDEKPLAAVLVTVCLAAPLGLLVCCCWKLRGNPRANWPPLAVLLVSIGVLFAASGPLFDASVYLNFMAHRPAYDRIIAETSTGELSGPVDANGQIVGTRHGVSYQFNPARPRLLQFSWTRDGALLLAVYYDEGRCPDQSAKQIRRPGLPAPTLRASYSRHLAGHYCLMQAIA